MKEENLEVYESVVDKWSRLFKTKVGDMFSLEELAQEVWLAILVAEEADHFVEGGEASLETYLATCIRRHMIKLITNEVKHISSLGLDSEELTNLQEDSASDTVEAIDIMDKLRERVHELAISEPLKRPVRNKYYTYAPFVLEHMNDMTLDEIEKEAQSLGLDLNRDKVHRLKKIIKAEYKKLTLE